MEGLLHLGDWFQADAAQRVMLASMADSAEGLYTCELPQGDYMLAMT